MGNGESTSRRISMQRSDEGTIQISENVMLRLKGQKNRADPIDLLPGERIIGEDNLNLMLEKAFQQGVNLGVEDTQTDLNDMKTKLENESNENIHKVEAFWKEKLNEEQKQASDRLENIKNSFIATDSVDIEKIQKKASEQEEHLNNMLGKIEEERKAIQEKLSSHENELNDEFNRSVQDVEKRITPLQQAPICSEMQTKVLECYRSNKQQPLKCSKEVKDFVECVQSARLKLMQNKLMNK